MHTSIKKASLFKNLNLQYILKRSYTIDFANNPIIESSDKNDLIPKYPEKSLFSSLINKDIPDMDLIKLEKESAIQIKDKEESTQIKPYKKTENYILTKSDYDHIMNQYPKGKIEIFQYKNTKFTLVGTQYEFIPNKNIYKILLYTKPSVIMIQARPDQILKNFNYHPINDKGIFSNRKYFKQLLRKGYELMPSEEMRYKIYEDLKNTGLFIEDLDDNKSYKKYKPYELKERLTTEALATICLYAEKYGIDVIIGDIPELIYRQNIVNSLTLYQLQNIFTHCSREIALYPDLNPQIAYTMACLLYPDIFLSSSDKYMSTLFEYMIYKKYNNILAFCGLNQSTSIMKYLDHRKVSSLEKELKVIEPKKSMLRDTLGEEILEKHAILDVMFNGNKVMENFDRINFATTKQMIEKYADYLHIDSSRYGMFDNFHIRFLNKYQAHGEKAFKEGKKNLQREFYSKMNI